MLETGSLPPCRMPSDLLQGVRDLYDRRLYLQAYRAAQPLGPLWGWPGAAGLVLAGRLANNLGAPRLAAWLFVRAFRQAPADPEARYFYALYRRERRGPLAAWTFLRRTGALEGAPAGMQADWLALHAAVFAALR